MVPRYFVPPRAEPDPAPPARGPLLLHVLDVFRLGGPGRTPREIAVVVDRSGALHLLDPEELPPALTAQLHHHELVRGAPARFLDVAELWLLSIQLLEQPGDPPGLNDPVYAYGRLYGPLPEGPVGMLDGPLAITRADLLDGFVRAARDAFAVNTVPASRVMHALFPADRAEVIEQGRALVLAYPLVPAELLPGDPGNELLVASLVYDVLVATQADAKRSGAAHPLVGATLPVPSREDLERDLDAQGWDIKGNLAIRRSEATKKGTIGSVFAQVFGVPDAMKLDLPPEGSVDDLLRIAGASLSGFTGFPDRRANAVRARVGSGPPRAGPPPRSDPHVPKASAPPPARDPSAKQGPELRRPDADDWRRDFSGGGSRPGSTGAAPKAKPRITKVGRGGSPPSSKPDWMKDFGDD